eukprot:tig00000178_g12777.t1
MAAWEAALGPSHPNAAVTANNLAALYGALGRRDEAEALYKRALAIQEAALGPAHPDTAQSLHNLGVLLLERGRAEEAVPPLERALGALEPLLGAAHGHVRACAAWLAEGYGAVGRREEEAGLRARLSLPAAAAATDG